MHEKPQATSRNIDEDLKKKNFLLCLLVKTKCNNPPGHTVFEPLVAGRLYLAQKMESVQNKTIVNELFHHLCEAT